MAIPYRTSQNHQIYHVLGLINPMQFGPVQFSSVRVQSGSRTELGWFSSGVELNPELNPNCQFGPVLNWPYWEPCSPKHDTWEPLSNLANAQDPLRDFEAARASRELSLRRVPTVRNGGTRSGRIQRKRT